MDVGTWVCETRPRDRSFYYQISWTLRAWNLSLFVKYYPGAAGNGESIILSTVGIYTERPSLTKIDIEVGK